MAENRVTWVKDGVQPDALGFIDTGQQLLVLCNAEAGLTVTVFGELLSINDDTVIPFQESAVASLSGAIVRINLPRGFILSIVVRTGSTNSSAYATIYIVQGMGSFQYIKFLGRGHVPFSFPALPTSDINLFTRNITPGAGAQINTQFSRNGAVITPVCISTYQINDATAANRFLTFYFQSGGATICVVPSLAISTAGQTTRFCLAKGVTPSVFYDGSVNTQTLAMPDILLSEFSGTPVTIGTYCENFQAGDQYTSSFMDYKED